MTIWIDLENSPHVPFFAPIIRELRAKNVDVVITARDFAQTKQLVEDAGLDARIIGKEAGDNTIIKTAALLLRALRLAIYLRGRKIDLAVAHGSRGSLIASKLLRIPTLTLYDYEGANVRLFNRLADWVMTPAIIPDQKLATLGLPADRSLRYHGLKEEVYVSDYTPDPSFASQLKLDPSKIIVIVRPPSHTAHYKSDRSFALFSDIMTKLAARNDVAVIFTPRSIRQSDEIRTSTWFDADKMTILERPVNGLDLMGHSDLVIGGGGTMNREAAVLGVPVVSIFKGESGAVDEWLEREGKLHDLESAEEIDRFIRKRDSRKALMTDTSVRETILSTILRLAKR
ncbi:MAG TPA: DUF354 domain-containing protein [Candidatus Kapabacteria bacterium]|nr:DUF354 domain-containing protein [Candidatus Kapabacteria bacterium]